MSSEMPSRLPSKPNLQEGADLRLRIDTMLPKAWLAVLVVLVVATSGIAAAILWFGRPAPTPEVKAAPAIEWTAERPWYAEYSSPVEVLSLVTSTYRDAEIETTLTVDVFEYWPLPGYDEFRIDVNLSTQHLQGIGSGTAFRLTTDTGSISWDSPVDGSEITSSRYDSATRTAFIEFKSTVIHLGGGFNLWWHLGGAPTSIPNLEGVIQVGYSVSGRPRLVEFPVRLELQKDSSEQAPVNVTLPFASNAFIGDGDATDSFRFGGSAGSLLEVNVSRLWSTTFSIEVTLVDSQGTVLVRKTFVGGDDYYADYYGSSLLFSLPATGNYTLETSAYSPMFYRIGCAILS